MKKRRKRNKWDELAKLPSDEGFVMRMPKLLKALVNRRAKKSLAKHIKYLLIEDLKKGVNNG